MYRFKQDRPEEVSLWEILRTKAVACFDLNDIRSFLRQVVTALDHPKSLHGILTPGRIQMVVKRSNKQQVISTEYSRFEVSKSGPFRLYMAPEKLVGLWTTEKSHVWSLGCIVAEMFLGYPLYTGDSNYEVIRNITHSCGDFPDHLLDAGSITKEFYFISKQNKWVLKTPTQYGVKSPKSMKLVSLDALRKHQQRSGMCDKTKQADLEHFIDLVSGMLVLDPKIRIPLCQVLQHPFLRGNKVHPVNVHTFTRQEIPSTSTKVEKKDLPSHSGKGRKPSTVWVIGSGYYISGAQHTANQCFGENLGLNVKMTWIGQVGMRWQDVLKTFNIEASKQRSFPDMLILHVGANDLGNKNVIDLTSEMVKVLTHLNGTFPRMKIGYSFITPRLAWGIFDPMKTNADRMTVNKTVQLNAGKFNAFVIEHPSLTPFESGLFKTDGVQFSSKGFEMFVHSIREAIDKTLNSTFTKGKPQPQTHVGNVYTKPTCVDSHLTSEEKYLSDVRNCLLNCIDKSEEHSSPTKKRSVTGENSQNIPSIFKVNQEVKNDHPSEGSKPSPKRANLKRKLVSDTNITEDLSPPPKKRSVTEENSQNIPSVYEVKQELKNDHTSEGSKPSPKRANLKRKLVSDTNITEDLSPPPKKRSVTEENSQNIPSVYEVKQEFKNDHTSEGYKSSPKRANLKRKLRSDTDETENFSPQPKKRMGINENNIQDEVKQRAGKLLSSSPLATQTKSEKMNKEASSSPDIVFLLDSSPTAQTHNVSGATVNQTSPEKFDPWNVLISHDTDDFNEFL